MAAIKNSLTAEPKKVTFSNFIKAPAVLGSIQSTLGDETKSKSFVARLISAVSSNPALQECDAISIVNAGLQGEALDLPPSKELGYTYMMPFKAKGKNGAPDKMVATFVLGYKGYLQLAIRSGQYRRINVLDIKEGELVKFDPLNEEIEVDLIQDELERENAKTVGYYAMFELNNGFRKAIYWSKQKMAVHADTYSPAFSINATTGKFPKVSFKDFENGKIPKGTEWQYSSFWYKDFDGMAFKTMIRQLISKWGIMSVEMRRAFENDDTFKDDFEKSPTFANKDNVIDEPIDVEVTEKMTEEPKAEDFSTEGTF